MADEEQLVPYHPAVQQLTDLMSNDEDRVFFHPEDWESARKLCMAAQNDRAAIIVDLSALVVRLFEHVGEPAFPAIERLMPLIQEMISEQDKGGDGFNGAALSQVAKHMSGVATESRAPTASDLDRSKKAEVKPKRGLR